MRQASRVLFLGALLALAIPSVGRAETPAAVGFWIAGELGYGSVAIDTDASSHSKGTLAMGVEGGYAFNRTVSVGLRLNGWTLESSNLQDPAKGESISLFSAMVRVYPWADHGLFLRGGVGSLRYTNNHPGGFGGNGTGLFLGGGYEFPLWRRLQIAPVLDYAWGKLDDVDNALATIHGRRCKALSFGISLKFS